MTSFGIQTFDNRQQIIVAPGEIKPGDWLRDLGTLRQVGYVDALSVNSGPGTLYVIHFTAQSGVADKALGISSSTQQVTIWREQQCPQSAPSPGSLP